MTRFFTKVTVEGTVVEVVTARRAYFVVNGEWEPFRKFAGRDDYEEHVKRLMLENYCETLTPPPFNTGKTSSFVYELRADAMKKIADSVNRPRAMFLRCWLTEYRWQQWRDEEITDEAAVNMARKRFERYAFKRLAEDEMQLTNVLAGTEPRTITVVMEYTRTGAVHATVNVDDKKVYKGSAYGYGYDKRSAALADALNKSYDALSVLAHAKEAALENGESDWSAYATSGRCNHDMLGYGSGYSVIPYFERGVGMESLIGLFNKQGYHADAAFGDYADAYVIEKKEVI